MNEKELADKFKQLYIDFDVYEEVYDCDMIVDMGVLRVAVEVKKQFSFKVMEQALRSKRYANMSYVAVPKTRRSKYHFREMICKKYHKWNSAGSNSTDKVWTDFQYTVHLIEKHLKLHDGSAKYSSLFEHIDHHYSSNSSFTQCIRRYINKGILSQFYIDKGVIYLKFYSD